MKRMALLLVLATACADASGSMADTTNGIEIDDTTSTIATGVVGGDSTTSTTTSIPDHDRDLAPDFTLILADGETFTLSEGTRPVYLVFWAEWCPVCRRELPVVDLVAADYADRVDFVAPVWKSGLEAATQAAESLFQSGQIKWGMDSEEVIFGLYGVPYQPVTVLIAADGTVAEAWPGVRPESQIRSSLDELLALSQ
jgi:peroxiredoxin